MKFNWIWLIFGIVSIAIFASSEKRYGKLIFAIVVVGALFMASDKIFNKVTE